MAIAPFWEKMLQVSRFMNVAVGDINSDRREDLVFQHELPGEDTYLLHVFEQSPDHGLPGRPSAKIRVESTPGRSGASLADLNNDGRADLVQTIFTEEPYFLPMMHSGKVIVQIFLAKSDGLHLERPDFIFRKFDWNPRVPLVDIDGDGRTDLILGYFRWKGRDDIIRSMETQQFSLDFRIHFGDAARGYRSEPDLVVPAAAWFEARVDDIGIPWSDSVDQSFRFDGDFNGDGRRDLLYRSGEDTLAVRFFKSREEGFTGRPGLSFTARGMGRFPRLCVRDLDGDNVSDLAVFGEDDNSVTIFLSGRHR